MGCLYPRRHQKIIEEAPSSVLSSAQRKTIGEHSVLVAKSCKYTGAGTVEFLLDEKGNHYFLEMNTRLQVEHPVTEMITGLDLVEWQIRIAEGHPPPLSQDEIQMNGHSIELRVYAENVKDGFIPSTGKLIRYQQPSGDGVRVDDGYEEGMEIPVHYDPMISKLIVHGNNRIDAIRRMTGAITGYEVQGVETTLGYGKFAINHPDFVSGNFDTHFVEKNKLDFLKEQSVIDQAAAGFTAWLYEKKKKILVLPKMDDNQLT